MIFASTTLAILAAPLTNLIVGSNLLDVCHGFVTVTPQNRPGGMSMRSYPRRTLPTLHYQEDDAIVVDKSPEATAAAILQGKPLLVPHLLLDVEQVASAVCSLEDGAACGIKEDVSLALPKLHRQSLLLITFEDDIEKFLDITKPYYALDNEYAIVDDTTGEMVGFVCTGKVEMPAGRESGGIPFAEAGRHMGAAGSVAALLRNPQKKRFHYPASQYHWETYPCKGSIKDELAKINGGHQLLQTRTSNDPIIFVRCTDFSKRTASCDILLENDDTTFHLAIDFSVVPAALFKRKYPPPSALATIKPSTDINTNMDTKKPYETFGSLANVKSYTDITKQWLTMETTLPPSKLSDCYGHFSNGNPCLPHSVMLFHNGDLVGKAISEFTGIDLPFKQNDYGQEHGVRMLSWTCLPETLHFPDTYGLKLQAKVFLSKGELGKPGSTYRVESEVKQDTTGVTCYKANGTFILEPIKFLKSEFRRAIGNKDFNLLWEKLDINGDGVVSREELLQFVTSSGMALDDDQEFDILFEFIDGDKNGELSFVEVKHFFNKLYIKQDLKETFATFLETGSPDEVSALWSQLDIDGDGAISREEFLLQLIVDSDMAGVYFKQMDTNGDGEIDFSEFREYLYILKNWYDYEEHDLVVVPYV